MEEKWIGITERYRIFSIIYRGVYGQSPVEVWEAKMLSI